MVEPRWKLPRSLRSRALSKRDWGFGPDGPITKAIAHWLGNRGSSIVWRGVSKPDEVAVLFHEVDSGAPDAVVARHTSAALADDPDDFTPSTANAAAPFCWTAATAECLALVPRCV